MIDATCSCLVFVFVLFGFLNLIINIDLKPQRHTTQLLSEYQGIRIQSQPYWKCDCVTFWGGSRGFEGGSPGTGSGTSFTTRAAMSFCTKVQDVNNQERLGGCMVEPCQSNRTAKTSRIQFGYWRRRGALLSLEAQRGLHQRVFPQSVRGQKSMSRKDLCHVRHRPEASTSWL